MGLLGVALLDGCAATSPEPLPMDTPPPWRLPPRLTRGAATAPVASDDPQAIHAERASFGRAFDELDLLQQEIADLHPSTTERAELAGLFGDASRAWGHLRSELADGRLPSARERLTVAEVFQRTRERMQSLIGPERAARLAGLRRSPRGGGRRWALQLREAIDDQSLTAEQSRETNAFLSDLSQRIAALSGDEPASEPAEATERAAVQHLIEQTDQRLSHILTPTQLDDVIGRLPSLAKPSIQTRPTQSP